MKKMKFSRLAALKEARAERAAIRRRAKKCAGTALIFVLVIMTLSVTLGTAALLVAQNDSKQSVSGITTEMGYYAVERITVTAADILRAALSASDANTPWYFERNENAKLAGEKAFETIPKPLDSNKLTYTEISSAFDLSGHTESDAKDPAVDCEAYMSPYTAKINRPLIEYLYTFKKPAAAPTTPTTNDGTENPIANLETDIGEVGATIGLQGSPVTVISLPSPELEVTQATTSTNVARGKTTKQNSFRPASEGAWMNSVNMNAAKLVDGTKASTNWLDNWMPAANDNDKWKAVASVDLGAATKIDRIVLYPRDNSFGKMNVAVIGYNTDPDVNAHGNTHTNLESMPATTANEEVLYSLKNTTMTTAGFTISTTAAQKAKTFRYVEVRLQSWSGQTHGDGVALQEMEVYNVAEAGESEILNTADLNNALTSIANPGIDATNLKLTFGDTTPTNNYGVSWSFAGGNPLLNNLTNTGADVDPTLITDSSGTEDIDLVATVTRNYPKAYTDNGSKLTQAHTVIGTKTFKIRITKKVDGSTVAASAAEVARLTDAQATSVLKWETIVAPKSVTDDLGLLTVEDGATLNLPGRILNCNLIWEATDPAFEACVAFNTTPGVAGGTAVLTAPGAAIGGELRVYGKADPDPVSPARDVHAYLLKTYKIQINNTVPGHGATGDKINEPLRQEFLKFALSDDPANPSKDRNGTALPPADALRADPYPFEIENTEGTGFITLLVDKENTAPYTNDEDYQAFKKVDHTSLHISVDKYYEWLCARFADSNGATSVIAAEYLQTTFERDKIDPTTGKPERDPTTSNIIKEPVPALTGSDVDAELLVTKITEALDFGTAYPEAAIDPAVFVEDFNRMGQIDDIKTALADKLDAAIQDVQLKVVDSIKDSMKIGNKKIEEIFAADEMQIRISLGDKTESDWTTEKEIAPGVKIQGVNPDKVETIVAATGLMDHGGYKLEAKEFTYMDFFYSVRAFLPSQTFTVTANLGNRIVTQSFVLTNESGLPNGDSSSSGTVKEKGKIPGKQNPTNNNNANGTVSIKDDPTIPSPFQNVKIKVSYHYADPSGNTKPVDTTQGDWFSLDEVKTGLGGASADDRTGTIYPPYIWESAEYRGYWDATNGYDNGRLAAPIKIDSSNPGSPDATQFDGSNHKFQNYTFLYWTANPGDKSFTGKVTVGGKEYALSQYPKPWDFATDTTDVSLRLYAVYGGDDIPPGDRLTYAILQFYNFHTDTNGQVSASDMHTGATNYADTAYPAFDNAAPFNNQKITASFSNDKKTLHSPNDQADLGKATDPKSAGLALDPVCDLPIPDDFYEQDENGNVKNPKKLIAQYPTEDAARAACYKFEGWFTASNYNLGKAYFTKIPGIPGENGYSDATHFNRSVNSECVKYLCKNQNTHEDAKGELFGVPNSKTNPTAFVETMPWNFGPNGTIDKLNIATWDTASGEWVIAPQSERLFAGFVYQYPTIEGKKAAMTGLILLPLLEYDGFYNSATKPKPQITYTINNKLANDGTSEVTNGTNNLAVTSGNYTNWTNDKAVTDLYAAMPAQIKTMVNNKITSNTPLSPNLTQKNSIFPVKDITTGVLPTRNSDEWVVVPDAGACAAARTKAATARILEIGFSDGNLFNKLGNGSVNWPNLEAIIYSGTDFKFDDSNKPGNMPKLHVIHAPNASVRILGNYFPNNIWSYIGAKGFEYDAGVKSYLCGIGSWPVPGSATALTERATFDLKQSAVFKINGDVIFKLKGDGANGRGISQISNITWYINGILNMNLDKWVGDGGITDANRADVFDGKIGNFNNSIYYIKNKATIQHCMSVDSFPQFYGFGDGDTGTGNNSGILQGVFCFGGSYLIADSVKDYDASLSMIAVGNKAGWGGGDNLSQVPGNHNAGADDSKSTWNYRINPLNTERMLGEGMAEMGFGLGEYFAQVAATQRYVNGTKNRDTEKNGAGNFKNLIGEFTWLNSANYANIYQPKAPAAPSGAPGNTPDKNPAPPAVSIPNSGLPGVPPAESKETSGVTVIPNPPDVVNLPPVPVPAPPSVTTPTASTELSLEVETKKVGAIASISAEKTLYIELREMRGSGGYTAA